MKPDIKDNELQALMSEVQKELDTLLKAEQEKLAKAHPGEETSSEVPADESATASDDAGGSEDGPPSADAGPPADSAPDASAATAAPPADDASAPPADGSADPAADQGLNPEALKAEYAGLPLEELKMHYLAAKEALFAAMGAGGDPAAAGGAPAPGMDASAPPAPPAAASAPPAAASAPPAPPIDDPSAPPALKAEKSASNPANGGQVTKVSKSEKDGEIEELKKKLGDLEAVLPGLIQVVEVAVSAPARKAVTSVAQLEKSGPSAASLSKAEIDAKLKRAVRTNLNEGDREQINRYVISNGATGLDGIKHILESVK